MQVVKGDLTKQQVSAIVNPTNGRLSSWGGASGPIAQTAGPSYVQDCKDLLDNLPDGQTAVPECSSAVMACSGAGAWQHVIHAVVPRYGEHALASAWTRALAGHVAAGQLQACVGMYMPCCTGLLCKHALQVTIARKCVTHLGYSIW